MPDSFVIRVLEDSDFDRLHEIDVSEHIALMYRWVDGRLQVERGDWQRPRWDKAEWQEKVAAWRTHHHPDVWLGAFAAGQMAGEASLRYELAPHMAQLATLHIDRAHRRQGLARQLVQMLVTLAEEHGADELYVSAAESESAVGFYLSQGFRPTDTPDPRLFALEPKDIHMVRPLGPARRVSP